jgi:hypothetical protein
MDLVGESRRQEGFRLRVFRQNDARRTTVCLDTDEHLL